jgi:FkbM family methyltransferase
MPVLKRIYTLLRRRRRAKRLGVPFTRGADWQLPSRVLVQGHSIPIRGPDDNGTKVAFLDIFLDDCYGIEQVGRRVYARTILDVGAHAGFFSLHAGNVFPRSIIHAYEPNAFMMKYLKQHSEVGEASRFRIYQEAVGRENGRASMHLHEDSVQSRACIDERGEIHQVAFRECIERLGGQVDILKLDCEGAEWELFEDKESWKKINYLGMEYHLINAHKRREAIAAIKQLGFQVLFERLTGPTWGLLRAYRIR